MAASLVSTSRSVGQLRGALVRIAQAARQIVACYERFGPEEPWGFADPGGWKCSERYCEAWQQLPGRCRAVGASRASALYLDAPEHR